MKKLIAGFFSVLIFSGCALAFKHQLDDLYGTQQVRNRVVAPNKTHPGPNFYKDVKPILDRRCAVCHACYDAPCQLKLTSAEGIERGSSELLVYNSKRLIADNPTRLFIDSKDTAGWRSMDFYPVLNERNQTTEANLQGSVLFKMLELKNEVAAKDPKILPKSYDLNLDRDEQCPKIETFHKFAKDYPLWGMPYGLPKLKTKEYEVLKSWIAHGALIKEELLEDKIVEEKIKEWEVFFNAAGNKQQLMSRYLYEHLFLASLYFSDFKEPGLYRLVRSKTPTGEPVEIIATRRPYDDPGVDKFYYRLWSEKSSISSKTNMPYALDKNRMLRWQELFLNDNFEVSHLPDYDAENSANPFKVFSAIPVVSRYKFLLDEAEYIVMTFIKGPVCRGRIALSVIEERFWVAFVNPELPELVHEDDFLEEQADNLRLPSERSSNTNAASFWTTYSTLQKNYFKAKDARLSKLAREKREQALKTIWDGDKVSTNAALTIFRQGDAATVTRGWVGRTPKTAWVIGYTLLERIYYLLVAGYDVFGNYGHQLNSRLYMDFLRMEGEYNFLSMLPYDSRIKERNFWYRNASDKVFEYLSWGDKYYSFVPACKFKTDNHKEELLSAMKTNFGKALTTSDNLEYQNDIISSKVIQLMGKTGQWVRFLPELAFLRIKTKNGFSNFSLFHDLGYSNVATPLFDSDRRRPDEDSLTILKGIHGAYPNAFFEVTSAELDYFISTVMSVQSEEDYVALLDKFGIRRTDLRFWDYSDWLHKEMNRNHSHHAGILDYNRFENR